MYLILAIITLLTIIVIGLNYIITLFYSIYRSYKLVKNIPTVPSLPIIGHAHLLYQISSYKELIDMISEVIHSSTDRIGKCWFGPKLLIALANPKHIEYVLTNKFAMDKDSMYKFIGYFGTGLFIEKGYRWKELRKPLNKLMKMKLIESNFQFMQESAKKFVKCLEIYAKTGNEIELRHIAANYTLDVLSTSTMGYNTDELSCVKYEIGSCVAEMLKHTVRLMATPHLVQFPFLCLLSGTSRRLKKLSKRLCFVTSEILDGRKAQLHLEENGFAESKYYSDTLIKIGENYNLKKEELARLGSDYIMAGFDAPAAEVANVIMLLCMHPAHEEAVYREQIEILGEDLTVMPNLNDIAKMHYLNRVIKETLRLFTATSVLRKLNEDITVDEYTLPKGCTIYISIYDLHRESKYWSHPFEFHPDHFLPAEEASRPKGVYIPFSYGPRACPGAQYGLLKMKVLLSAILRRYKFHTDKKFDDITYEYSLLLEPDNCHSMTVTMRN